MLSLLLLLLTRIMLWQAHGCCCCSSTRKDITQGRMKLTTFRWPIMWVYFVLYFFGSFLCYVAIISTMLLSVYVVNYISFRWLLCMHGLCREERILIEKIQEWCSSMFNDPGCRRSVTRPHYLFVGLLLHDKARWTLKNGKSFLYQKNKNSKRRF